MEVQKLYNQDPTTCADRQGRLASQPQPSANDAQEFANAYEKGGQGREGHGQHGSKDGERESPQSMPSSGSVMENLSFSKTPEATPVPPQGSSLQADLDGTQGKQELPSSLGEDVQKLISAPTPSKTSSESTPTKMFSESTPTKMFSESTPSKMFNESTPSCGDKQCSLPTKPQPAANDAQTFALSHEADSQESEELRQQAPKNEGQQNPLSMPSPDSLMESLFSNRMSVQPSVPSQEAVPVKNVSETMEKIVDRILVAESTQGKQEVRLTLGDGPLKGAELSIMRHADGQLAIHVSCTDAASFQTAVSARQDLTDALESRGERVQVVVKQGDSSGGNEGDTRQRSKGLQSFDNEEESRGA
ncbi:MAG: hypothetical protein K5657_05295 [Desulfovibrio sp.]|nr:hypothetical protein [Desulfovibrio sp.]